MAKLEKVLETLVNPDKCSLIEMFLILQLIYVNLLKYKSTNHVTSYSYSYFCFRFDGDL